MQRFKDERIYSLFINNNFLYNCNYNSFNDMRKIHKKKKVKTNKENNSWHFWKEKEIV